MQKIKNVDAYIAAAPKEVRGKLKELRGLIKKFAPTAEERISYGMPFYDYKGRLVYFANAKGYIGLYIPPPIIAQHPTELKTYVTTKSAIHLPFKKLPMSLIKKLVKARMKYNESKNNNLGTNATNQLRDGAMCKVIGGTHAGKTGTVHDIKTGKTGHVSITVKQPNGVRFKTLAKNVVILTATA